MMINKTPLVLGVFQQEADARSALKALKQAGFADDQLGFARHKTGNSPNSLLHELVKWGVPEERGAYYESEYEAGHPILSVRADGREQEATHILQQYGAYGQEPQQQTSEDTTMAAETPIETADKQHALRLRAERLNVTKQSVESGEAQFHKQVIEEQQAIDVPVNHEEVFIQRRAISDGHFSDSPIGQDETIRIPVLEEQVIVTKSVVETGEVAISKRTVQEKQRVTDTVRHEEVRVDKEGNARIHTNEDVSHP